MSAGFLHFRIACKLTGSNPQICFSSQGQSRLQAQRKTACPGFLLPQIVGTCILQKSCGPAVAGGRVPDILIHRTTDHHRSFFNGANQFFCLLIGLFNLIEIGPWLVFLCPIKFRRIESTLLYPKDVAPSNPR